MLRDRRDAGRHECGRTVDDVVVTQPLAPVLDAAAVDALKRWRFTPGMKNGVPVPMELTIWFEFKLT